MKTKKINLTITGCLGRMGQQLIKSASKDKRFKINSLTENKLERKKIREEKMLNPWKAMKTQRLQQQLLEAELSFKRLRKYVLSVANSKSLLREMILQIHWRILTASQSCYLLRMPMLLMEPSVSG